MQKRGTPLPVALLVAILVIGVGGWAAAEGVRYAVGYVTGNEPGTERLVRSASASSGGLTLTVDSVETTSHFTRVDLAARNESGESLALPLFGNCVFSGADGTTLEADPSRSRWSERSRPEACTAAPSSSRDTCPTGSGARRSGFATIFRLGGGSITVADIRLRRA